MASDNFNRANETPPTGWTQDSVLTDAIGVVSNQVQNTNVGTPGVIYYGASSVADSQIVYHGSGSGGPAMHCDGSGNLYATLAAYLMYRFDAGVSTLIAFFGPGAADGDVVREYRTGSDVVANDNGSEILRATDTTYTTGHPGIYADYGFLGPVDDWTDGVSGGGGNVVTKTATDTLSVTDESVQRAFAITMGDALETSDQMLSTRGLYRLASDTFTLIDTLIKTLTGSSLITKVVTDGFVLIDDFAKQLKRMRGADDGVSMADGVVSSASRNRQGSDSVAIADQGLRSWLRGRLTTDSVSPIDQALLTVARLRDMVDAISVTEILVQARLRIRIIDENARITDGVISSFQPIVQYDVRVMIGTDPSGIVCGADDFASLGSEDAVRLGGYN